MKEIKATMDKIVNLCKISSIFRDLQIFENKMLEKASLADLLWQERLCIVVLCFKI